MSVPKGKRKESQFEVIKNFYKLRKEITDLLLRDFGYSQNKYEKRLEKLFGGKPYEELNEKQKEHYNKKLSINNGFEEWFVAYQRDTVMECIKKATEYIFTANSIYPSILEELNERRIYQDKAIGQCYRLLQELQYTIETLPVDIEKYTRFSDMINKEIDLLKGWRKADDLLLNMFKNLIDDELALWLLDGVLKQAKIDVSFMTKEQFSNSLNEIFNSLEYEKVDKKLMTGEKFLAKHMNIGDQVAQVAGIFYPHRLDNYIKIVEGEKYYGRYMDDFYVISRDKEHLKELSSRIRREAKRNGIILNENKTRICKISQYWRYLQIQYALTENGRVIKKIHPKRLTVMRRKLKKLAKKLSEVDFINYYNSWFKNQYKLMSKKQRENMNELFKNLKEEHYVSNNA